MKLMPQNKHTDKKSISEFIEYNLKSSQRGGYMLCKQDIYCQEPQARKRARVFLLFDNRMKNIEACSPLATLSAVLYCFFEEEAI